MVSQRRWCDEISWWLSHLHHPGRIHRVCILGGHLCGIVWQSHWRDGCGSWHFRCTASILVVRAILGVLSTFRPRVTLNKFFLYLIPIAARNRYKPNGIVVGISLAFTALNILAIVIDWAVFSPLVEFLALFYGVFIGYYSVWDIYDDLVTRTAEGSDAVACHQLVPCCFPRCVGVQFWIVAFLFQVAGLYIALVWQVSNQQF
jgi:Peptidase M50B-like